MVLSVPGSLGWHYEHRDTVTIMDTGGTFYLNQLWNMCPMYISCICPVHYPPCGPAWALSRWIGVRLWDIRARTELTKRKWCMVRIIWTRVKTSRARCHILCPDQGHTTQICFVMRVTAVAEFVCWGAHSSGNWPACVCFQDSESKTNIWREAEGISLKMVT